MVMRRLDAFIPITRRMLALHRDAYPGPWTVVRGMSAANLAAPESEHVNDTCIIHDGNGVCIAELGPWDGEESAAHLICELRNALALALDEA